LSVFVFNYEFDEKIEGESVFLFYLRDEYTEVKSLKKIVKNCE